MKKGLIIIISLISLAYLYAQNTTWKKINIDENLTMFMPGEVTRVDTSFIKNGQELRFRVFKTETESSTLALTITPNETNLRVDNLESLQTALEKIAEGSCNAAIDKGLLCSTTDTAIDEIPGKKNKIYSKNSNNHSVVFNYIFLVNDKMYMFSTAFSTNAPAVSNAVQEAHRFLNDIHFNKTAIKEQKFKSKAESLGYNLGKLILPVLLIVGIIVYIVRRH